MRYYHWTQALFFSDVETTSGGGIVPTVTDTAWNLGLLDSKLIGIFFAPPTSTSGANGELTFGGVDSSKFKGGIHYLYVF